MATNTTKMKYTTPSVKVVDWDFNEDICVQPVCNSFNSCFRIEKGTQNTFTEIRRKDPGTWERVNNETRW